MQRISLVKQVHQTFAEKLNQGDIAIDATVGNGHDTLFLSQQVGETGQVYGFDIQQMALETCLTRLQENHCADNVQLIQQGHEVMAKYIPAEQQGNIHGILFNLGYLPNSDKRCITQTKTTLVALNATLNLLAKTGLLSIIAYPGHAGGDIETQAVIQWCQQLPKNCYDVKIIKGSEQAHSPQLFLIHPINNE